MCVPRENASQILQNDCGNLAEIEKDKKWDKSFQLKEWSLGTRLGPDLQLSSKLLALVPDLHPSLGPRPASQPRFQTHTPALVPGLHPNLGSRPTPQPWSQACIPALVPDLHPSLVPGQPYRLQYKKWGDCFRWGCGMRLADC